MGLGDGSPGFPSGVGERESRVPLVFGQRESRVPLWCWGNGSPGFLSDTLILDSDCQLPKDYFKIIIIISNRGMIDLVFSCVIC
jgi:hypothetical protein